MSSLGASCARVYIMEKQQKEKLKKMEEERLVRTSDGVGKERRSNESSSFGKSQKIHPGNFGSSESAKSNSDK